MSRHRVVCYKCNMITSKIDAESAIEIAKEHATKTGHETSITSAMTFGERSRTVPVAELEALTHVWYERETEMENDTEAVDEVSERRREVQRLSREYRGDDIESLSDETKHSSGWDDD